MLRRCRAWRARARCSASRLDCQDTCWSPDAPPRIPGPSPARRLGSAARGSGLGSAGWALRARGLRAGLGRLRAEVRGLGSDGVSGGFGGVLAASGGGPADEGGGELVDFPAWVLLEPVVVAAFGAAVAQAGFPACLERDVVFEVALPGGAAADGAGAGVVPDAGEVPELDAGVVPGGGEPVVAGVGGEGVEADQQVAVAGDAGGEPPGSVAARRTLVAGAGEGESGAKRAGRAGGMVRAGRIVGAGWRFRSSGLGFLRFGPGASVAGGVSLAVGDRDLPFGLGAAGGGAGQVAG